MSFSSGCVLAPIKTCLSATSKLTLNPSDLYASCRRCYDCSADLPGQLRPVSTQLEASDYGEPPAGWRHCLSPTHNSSSTLLQKVSWTSSRMLRNSVRRNTHGLTLQIFRITLNTNTRRTPQKQTCFMQEIDTPLAAFKKHRATVAVTGDHWMSAKTFNDGIPTFSDLKTSSIRNGHKLGHE